MLYEVAQSRNLQDEWRVEAIDDAIDGAVHVTLFYGPQAHTRAHEYAEWKNRELNIGERPVARARRDSRRQLGL